jgi:hypothetical protein
MKLRGRPRKTSQPIASGEKKGAGGPLLTHGHGKRAVATHAALRAVWRVRQATPIGKNDGPIVEIPMGNYVFRMTEKGLTKLLEWLHQQDGAPEGTYHEPSEASDGEAGGQ